jgi:hypothetical protein
MVKTFNVYPFSQNEVLGSNYEVKINDTEVPLHIARVSAVPFNRRWPGYQRSESQSELINFASFSMSEPVHIAVKPQNPFKEVVIKPFSKGITPKVENGIISFDLNEPSPITVEVDGYHNALHLFADPPKEYDVDISDSNVIYFGKGEHDAGMLEMKSNQIIFIDEGAVVYACIHAVDADNIKIVGRGILDNSRNKEKILFKVEAPHQGVDVGNAHRLHTIQLEYCTNIEIDGITIRDSLVYNIRPIACENMNINNVKIIGCWRYNSDGIDMHNCVHTSIRNCFIRTFDDSICVKGFDFYQKEEDMLHNGKNYNLFDDIIVEKCVIWTDWGKSLEIGAETRAAEIRNVIFRDCDIIRGSSIVLDVMNVDYADVHDILFEDIRVDYTPVIQPPCIQENDSQVYVEDPNSPYLPKLMGSSVVFHHEYSAGGKQRGKNRNITFKDISVKAKSMPDSEIIGFDEEHQSSDIRICNLYFNDKKITSLHDANVRVNEFVSNITIE